MVFVCPVCRCTLSAGIVQHAQDCGLIVRNNYIGWFRCLCGVDISTYEPPKAAEHLCSPHDWDKLMVRKEMESM